MSEKGASRVYVLHGRPRTEWSTPPTSLVRERDTLTINHKLGDVTLESDSESTCRLPYNKVSSTLVSKYPLNPFQVSSNLTTSPNTRPATTNQTISQFPDLTLSSQQHSASFKPLSPQCPEEVFSRQRHNVSSSTPIPTALVTPLPGTSPPQPTSDLHIHDQHPWRMSAREEENRHKRRNSKKEQETMSGLPVLPADNTVELIDKWKALIDTKDVILKQKNLQIERQKTTITKLQQDVHELEAKLHLTMVAQVRDHKGGSVLEARLQALEAENSSIKAQLTEALSSQTKEFCSISTKLDQKEYELHQAVIYHEQSAETCQLQFSNLQEEINDQQKCIRELEQKLAGSEAACEHYIKQIDKLNKYMGNMPSMEEHQTVEMQNQEMRAQCKALTQHLSKTESALKTTLENVKTKDMVIQSLDGVKAELENMRVNSESHKKVLAVLEPENRKLKQECEHLKKVVIEAERRCRQELQAMRERHRARFTEATANLRSQYKSLVKRARALESQLTRNSDAMIALNGELQSSQGTIGALKTSVKDLVSQNQGLLEKNLSLQESTALAMKVSSSLTEAQSSAAQQLGDELSHCMKEFESLVGLSMSLMDGQEPTPTMLFGSDGCALPSEEELSVDYGLESRLHQVKQLRKKIEELRYLISEHFATQLSSACNVQ